MFNSESCTLESLILFFTLKLGFSVRHTKIHKSKSIHQLILFQGGRCSSPEKHRDDGLFNTFNNTKTTQARHQTLKTAIP